VTTSFTAVGAFKPVGFGGAEGFAASEGADAYSGASPDPSGGFELFSEGAEFFPPKDY
jgi:hypothetical protein